MTQPLHLKAYAKVNLGLDVLRRRLPRSQNDYADSEAF